MEVYALIDPRTDEVFWVGATTRTAAQRLTWHITDSRWNDNPTQEPRRARIREIVAAGLEPSAIIVEGGFSNQEVMFQHEREWIAVALAVGHPLTNWSPGGKFHTGPWTEERRATWSEHEREAWPEERRIRHSERMRQPGTVERLATAARVWTGRQHSDESKQKMSLTHQQLRSRCVECGMETNPGNVARHQKRTGHEGIATCDM